jgi:hypothetical protein
MVTEPVIHVPSSAAFITRYCRHRDRRYWRYTAPSHRQLYISDINRSLLIQIAEIRGGYGRGFERCRAAGVSTGQSPGPLG